MEKINFCGGDVFVTDLNWMNHSKCVLLFTGNPSIPELYFEFSKQISKKYPDVPILIPAFYEAKPIKITLEYIITEKSKFLERLHDSCPKTKFIILAHSVGSYVSLKALIRSPDFSSYNLKAYFGIFPTIENVRIGIAPFLHLLSNYPIILFLVSLFFRFIYWIMPLFLYKKFLSFFIGIPNSTLNYAARGFLYPQMMQALYMAVDEIKSMNDLTDDMKEFCNEKQSKMRMIYGKKDKYTTYEMFRSFKESYPKAECDIVDIEHAFILKAEEKMRKYLIPKLDKDIED